ncbi:saccharopine dehydrogenase NADP-binding domain-containing protein [Pseudomonas sp. BN411]|uniref:saccharopine dehydrogenase family protein n=1 Tax=Pseudomonas sp. BN411 TaxID=2567887 RepID=UPI002453F034|nr:saccharopine dehydrogenase NADP-binding domain-containing protein [Pseudomonas sp. BN411]MDH4560814.1 saccharopine dehydrogenase [Pseudomonas sp. BN411]
MARVLILGGYGNFGKRIAESLGKAHAGLEIVIAGRSLEQATRLCADLAPGAAPQACFEPARLDIDSPGFPSELAALAPNIVIHTSGPFQGQDYRVPRACIQTGAHYIDLADGRRYVCDIRALDDEAKERNVLIVSGASSVPGLSSTVIDHFRGGFSRLDAIDFAIAPGNKAEVGEATLKGILSYTGHPFPALDDGRWRDRHGWMDARRIDFGGSVGRRWLANVDIPDLELFPERYAGVRTVHFQAGLELPLLHHCMVAMAGLAKAGVVADWSPWAAAMLKARQPLMAFGTDIGGMRIELSGLGPDGRSKRLTWTLYAENGIGPYIPTLSAIILTNKLLRGEQAERGAMPCLGLFSLADFDAEAAPLGIYHRVSQ